MSSYASSSALGGTCNKRNPLSAAVTPTTDVSTSCQTHLPAPEVVLAHMRRESIYGGKHLCFGCIF